MTSSTILSKTGLNDDNVIFAANESEVQRLDKQHRVIRAAMPQLVLAPVDLTSGGKRILDQATGSGTMQPPRAQLLPLLTRIRDLDPRCARVDWRQCEYLGGHGH